MSGFRLSNRAARRVFMDRHLLLSPPQGPAKPQDMLDIIRALGFVQLDSINTVARAHDLILFSRRARYVPGVLKTLYEKDRGLFEHWTHDAAVIPLEYYPYWQLRRERDAITLKKQWRNWRREGFEAQLQKVLEHIRVQGPVSSSEVGKEEKRGSGGWWDWHPSKTALEYLWRTGALCVVERVGFQKRYDLTERVLAPQLHTPSAPPNEAEIIHWCCAGALERLGFATHTEIAAFWGHLSPAEAKSWCEQALARGEIMQIQVEGADAVMRPAYAWPSLPDDPALEATPPGRLRVLSPFDPMLRDRKRAARLFGFNYTVEMFVPGAKRKYGYYVFPLLERDRLIGRIDMKAFRDQDSLVVRALWPERGVRWSASRSKALEAELQRMLKLAGVRQIRFEKDWLRQAVNQPA